MARKREPVGVGSTAIVERTNATGPAFDPVERRRLADLKPYERNARIHPPAQLADLQRSMGHYGWTIPVLIDEDNGIIAGHARVEVALALGYEDAPVLVARGWDDAKKKAYILADNKLTERGGWNWELVSAELVDIRELGGDVSLAGFEEFELAPLLDAEWNKPDSDEAAAELPHGSTDGHTIKVTREQYEVIARAIDRQRQEDKQPRMSEGRALELIASAVFPE